MSSQAADVGARAPKRERSQLIRSDDSPIDLLCDIDSQSRIPEEL